MKKTNLFYIWWRQWKLSIVLLLVVIIEMLQLRPYNLEIWWTLVPVLLLFTTLMHSDYIRAQDIQLSQRYGGSREEIFKQVWISVHRPTWIYDRFIKWYELNKYWLVPFIVFSFILGFMWFPLKEELIGFIWFGIWLLVVGTVGAAVGFDLMLTQRSIGRVRDVMFIRGYTNYKSIRMMRDEAEHLGLIL